MPDIPEVILGEIATPEWANAVAVTVDEHSATIDRRTGAEAFATGYTIPAGTAVVPLTTEAWDSDGFHETVVNPSRFTIPAGLGGLYMVTYRLDLATPAISFDVITTLNPAGVPFVLSRWVTLADVARQMHCIGAFTVSAGDQIGVSTAAFGSEAGATIVANLVRISK